MKKNWTIWVIYLSLLAVLMPHTAWTFKQFEPAGSWGNVTAWAGALAFEAAIAVLTHKLAKHIESLPNYKDARKRFSKRYMNAYSVGLLMTVGVSTLANIAHAVEFGSTMVIFTKWNVPFGLYAVAFGGILPVASLVFARVLSDVNEAEHDVDPALVKANETIKQLRSAVRDSEREIAEANARVKDAETRFGAIGDMAAMLFGEDKRQRIITTRQLWPALPQSHIATVAQSSPAYVSEVLSSVNGGDEHG